ncbi:hypothetical protein Tco_0719493 [Tanacetum coccineum]
MSSNTFYEPPLVVEIDSVFGCIKSFPKGTSCRRYGLRAQHILDALCGEGSATATNLLDAITLVINLWLAGRKGTIWRRLVSKVAMKGVGKEMSKYLSDFKFGVGVSDGVEVVLHSVNRLLSEYHNDGSFTMLTVDLSNAFNPVDRWALLYEIKDSCKILLLAWYLDDGMVIRDSEEVVKVLEIIKLSGPGLGLELNIKKIEIFWPSCNGVKLREGLFPVNIRSPSLGVKLLGGAVSRDVNFISGMSIRRATKVVDLISLLPQLHDPQTLFFDKGLRGSIKNIVVCGGPFFGNLQRILASLSICLGGLGLYSEKVASSYAFVASRACLDSFEEYAVHCKELPSFKYRHDMVREVLFDICSHARIFAKKVAHVNFLTDPSDEGSTLRPADVLVFGWVGGKHACVDLAGVSPLVGLSSRGFIVGQDALKASSCKVAKHEKACIKNQHMIIPFAFDTFCFLAAEAVELLCWANSVPNDLSLGFE